MLQKFLTANREEILVRARKRAVGRAAATATELEPAGSLTWCLDQLADALLQAKIGGVVVWANGGLTVERAIDSYSDLCQVVTELAMERDAPISVQEFLTIDDCLDRIIAHMLTEALTSAQRVLAASALVRAAQRVARDDCEAVILGPTEWWLPSSRPPTFQPMGFRSASLYLAHERILARWHAGEADDSTTVYDLMALLPS